MLTSSLGWDGLLAAQFAAGDFNGAIEITSLTFMLVCVPLPVCQTLRGKCSVSFPS